MSSDKHIEEMYKDVYEAINHNCVIDVIHGGYIGVNTEGLTRELYDDGYRKASDVVEEIADFIWDKDIAGTLLPINGRYLSKQDFIAELKKKYTEEGKNV